VLRGPGRLAVIVVAAVVCATTTAGATTSRRRDPARDLEGVDRAMQESASFAFEGRVTLSQSPRQQVSELTVHGAADVERGLADFVMESLAPSTRLHYVVTSDAAYLELNGIPEPRPAALVDKKWARAPNGTGGSASDVVSLPSGIFDNVTAPGQTVTKVGKERIDGVRATHYHVAGRLPATTTARRTMELWIDEQDRVRQISQIVIISQGRFTQTTRSYIAYRDFGVPVSITIPPDEEVGSVDSLDDLGIGPI
jgi:hypothetical protein